MCKIAPKSVLLNVKRFIQNKSNHPSKTKPAHRKRFSNQKHHTKTWFVFTICERNRNVCSTIIMWWKSTTLLFRRTQTLHARDTGCVSFDLFIYFFVLSVHMSRSTGRSHCEPAKQSPVYWVVINLYWPVISQPHSVTMTCVQYTYIHQDTQIP